MNTIATADPYDSIIESELALMEAERKQLKAAEEEKERKYDEKVSAIYNAIISANNFVLQILGQSPRLADMVISHLTQETMDGSSLVLHEEGTSEPWVGYLCLTRRENGRISIGLYEKNILDPHSQKDPARPLRVDRCWTLRDTFINQLKKLQDRDALIRAIVRATHRA